MPKVDGFFSLTPRESDDVLSLFYTTTNADYPRLEDFLSVSQITAPDQIFHWQSRSNFLPLVTAGQKPVYLDDAATLRALTQPDFDGGKMVFLPPEAKPLVAATNQARARMISIQLHPGPGGRGSRILPNRRSWSFRRRIITTGGPRGWPAGAAAAGEPRVPGCRGPGRTAWRAAGIQGPRV